jgi:drug/metabolite transporter (DMT)-like permease
MLAGMLLGLGASACWALANVVVQSASRAIGPYRALVWAQVAGLVLVAIGVGARGGASFDGHALTAALTPAVLGWTAVAGVSGLLAYVCMFFALAHGRLTVAVPIMSSWAVLSSALSLVLFDQHLSAGQLLGAAAVVGGAVVVSRHAHSAADTAQPLAAGAEGPPAPRWLLASAGAALGFGVLIPAMGRLSPVFGSVGAVGVVYLADLLLGLPLALLFGVGLRPPSGRIWVPVFLAGLFETAGFACITLGADLAPLAIVSPLASLAAAMTMLYAWIVLRERPARLVLVGAGLVCAGVVAMSL